MGGNWEVYLKSERFGDLHILRRTIGHISV